MVVTMISNINKPNEIIYQLNEKINNYNFYIRIILEEKRDNISYLLNNNKIEAAKVKINELLYWMDMHPSHYDVSSFHEDAA